MTTTKHETEIVADTGAGRRTLSLISRCGGRSMFRAAMGAPTGE